LICKDGFRIGGVDVGIRVGSAYGLGVYTATEPSFSFAYSPDSKTLICCRALRGFTTTSQAKIAADLKQPGVHSYMSGDILILFNSHQVIPVYLITHEG